MKIVFMKLETYLLGIGVTRLYDTVYTTKTDVGLIKPDLAEVKGKVNWIVEKIEATTGEKYTAKK